MQAAVAANDLAQARRLADMRGRYLLKTAVEHRKAQAQASAAPLESARRWRSANSSDALA